MVRLDPAKHDHKIGPYSAHDTFSNETRLNLIHGIQVKGTNIRSVYLFSEALLVTSVMGLKVNETGF